MHPLLFYSLGRRPILEKRADFWKRLRDDLELAGNAHLGLGLTGMGLSAGYAIADHAADNVRIGPHARSLAITGKLRLPWSSRLALALQNARPVLHPAMLRVLPTGSLLAGSLSLPMLAISSAMDASSGQDVISAMDRIGRTGLAAYSMLAPAAAVTGVFAPHRLSGLMDRLASRLTYPGAALALLAPALAFSTMSMPASIRQRFQQA